MSGEEEILAGRGAQSGVFPYDFDRYIPVQSLVVSAVDGAHAAFANFRQHAATTEDLPDHKGLPFRPMLGRVFDSRQTDDYPILDGMRRDDNADLAALPLQKRKRASLRMPASQHRPIFLG